MSVGHPQPAELLAEWAALDAVSPGDRLFRSRRLDRPNRIDLRAGLRETDGAPCLIARSQGASDGLAMFETGGLRLSRAADPGGILLVLSLEEPSRRDLFAEVCSDVVRSLVRSEDEGETDLLPELAARLSAWRVFLRDQSGGLSRRETVGIIGELLLLDQLLDHGADAVGIWTAPDGGLHDFELSGHALEAKTSLGAARRLHISTLDQLDDIGLASLHVVHLRLVEAADGETLGQIGNRIEARLENERSRRIFRNALLQRGVLPDAMPGDGVRVRCIGTEFYAVTDEFPRLRRNDVALGIVEADYQIEVRALSGFQADAAWVFGTFGAPGDE
ncbi:PD-(D/E)XK motif protein [Nguyenibacter vanlangensis]|uniref:PD-(D/E)XK motif protein n=1 Tax=Nguyenibacter vanlangensis TaxID=1216886 RepID=A0A7Y7IUB3_9PROT|nr:PD-(D/E)XK motif protein [Nguyenibacter vanlangensis]NVN10476.1 PD-(D/E)XK motif protein [Nguyenibacter vanlangensis]